MMDRSEAKAFKHVLALMLLFGGCSSPVIKPIQMDLRDPVVIIPFEDLTSSYEKVEHHVEMITPEILRGDFLDVMERGRLDNQYVQTFYPNPFRVLGVQDSGQARFVIKGDVEENTYEPARNLSARIGSYAVWGLLGLVTFSESDMGAYVQYRISVYEKGRLLDSFVVQGASVGNVQTSSRRQLVNEANSFASFDLSAKLLLSVKKRYYPELPSQVEYLYDTEQLEARRSYYLSNK